ncbi:MAG: septum formation initiator family protein [Bacteroidetes bacterium]|nr:septum formation initiator family protein [Bacteroidota bacterium]MCZ6758185.1 septum formation initiator family protein [Bacteroidota bacterium]
MSWRSLIQNMPGQVRRWLLVAGAAFMLFWFVFFDSHSLLSRIRWHQESTKLNSENAQLRSEIDELEAQLARPLTDEDVERIAREEYGMTRPGEVVYRVEEK